MHIGPRDYALIRRVVRLKLGIELGDGRLALVQSRLAGDGEARSLVDSVRNGTLDAAGLGVLADRLTTNHTYFGREMLHLELLSDWLDSDAHGEVRIWCAACSTGQEAYAIWMACASSERGAQGVSILATDISLPAIRKAAEGIYQTSDIAKLPAGWRRFFEPSDPGCRRVCERARRAVLVRRFNLMTDPFPFRQRFDVVFCRNALIYFDAQTRLQVVQRQVDALRVGGMLFLGLAESLPGGVTGVERIAPSAFVRV